LTLLADYEAHKRRAALLDFDDLLILERILKASHL